MISISEKHHNKIDNSIGTATNYKDFLNEIHSEIEIVKKSDNSLNSNTPQILCVVKNGEFYIEKFIQHHKKLGIEHFIFIDNGSTDKTVEYLLNNDEVTILKSDLPYKTYWHHFKRYLFEYWGKGRWNLVLDIDEFFDFVGSQYYSINDIISYCEQYQFDSVMCQMLDLFPDDNILDANRNADFVKSHTYFSIENIKKVIAPTITGFNNEVSNYLIPYHMGGWRNQEFKVGEVMLTKQALVKHNKKVKFVHDHFVYGSNVADFSCLIKHYKFHPNFKGYVNEAVIEKNHFDNSREYNLYQSKIDESPILNFVNEKSLHFQNIDQLLQLEFVHISPSFAAYFKKIQLLEKKKINQNKIDHLTTINSELQGEIKKLKNSMSFKIGYAITRLFVPFISFFQIFRRK